MVGQKFGRLLVVAKAERSRYWICDCECGRTKEFYDSNLRRGISRSCNCMRTEIHRARLLRHGHTTRVNGRVRHSKEFRSWHNAKRRCVDANASNCANYGGRGIRMSPEWATSFQQFLADMGPCPAKHTIDRIDRDGHYEKGNCRWATPKTQANNTRVNHRVQFRGATYTISQLADIIGLSQKALRGRLIRRGFDVEAVVSEHLRNVRVK